MTKKKNKITGQTEAPKIDKVLESMMTQVKIYIDIVRRRIIGYDGDTSIYSEDSTKSFIATSLKNSFLSGKILMIVQFKCDSYQNKDIFGEHQTKDFVKSIIKATAKDVLALDKSAKIGVYNGHLLVISNKEIPDCVELMKGYCTLSGLDPLTCHMVITQFCEDDTMESITSRIEYGLKKADNTTNNYKRICRITPIKSRIRVPF